MKLAWLCIEEDGTIHFFHSEPACRWDYETIVQIAYSEVIK